MGNFAENLNLGKHVLPPPPAYDIGPVRFLAILASTYGPGPLMSYGPGPLMLYGPGALILYGPGPLTIVSGNLRLSGNRVQDHMVQDH